MRNRSAPPRRPSFRHLTPNSAGWSPPRAFRLLLGGTPPELAHRRVIEPDPMTLTVGSIFGSRSRTRQERSLKYRNRNPLPGGRGSLSPWGKGYNGTQAQAGASNWLPACLGFKGFEIHVPNEGFFSAGALSAPGGANLYCHYRCGRRAGTLRDVKDAGQAGADNPKTSRSLKSAGW